MWNCKLLFNILSSLMLMLLFHNVFFSQQVYPENHWKQYVNVVDAGFTQTGLDVVKEKFENSNGSSLLVIHEGKVLLSLGSTTRRFMMHSIRKSFMNGLYGAHSNNENLKLERTLNSLGINDDSPLSDLEKEATIGDLLSARSGIYLPSAYSPRNMEKTLPARGSHLPGTFWVYNNWDFNALSTIFEKETGKKIFEEFDNKFASPLKMEDYRVMDGYYRYEKNKSRHPAYLFKMSARDMARYGLLFLESGKWDNKQIIPKSWVNESTSPITKDLGSFNSKGSYGRLWWVSDGVNGQKMYYASGSGGQRLMVLPESNMIVVHLVNTYEGDNVSSTTINEMVEALVNAKHRKAIKNPPTSTYNPIIVDNNKIKLGKDQITKYLGSYKHPFLGNMIIQQGKSGLELKNSVGVFRLFTIDENHLFPEDIEELMEFVPSPESSKDRTIEPIYSKNRELDKVVFYY